ncbi:heavy-metal-associated domain-containing protein [Yeosuana sp.]|uniref:heavy-metal-associated domain-containing protein n=1 Tax=Yeosuana sp. TaxID=2529388 RepID=UPI00405503AC|tara:strand:+ start:1298 stop:1645 length:348 start_codon:yes stop_codon:yes gene_type:complete
MTCPVIDLHPNHKEQENKNKKVNYKHLKIKIMKQQVAIKGMSCGGCTQTVEKALKQVAGVKTVTVSLVPPQAVIQTDQVIGNAQLQSALSKVGNYRVAGNVADNEPKKSGGSCCG